MSSDAEANDALAGAARMREIVERLRLLLLAAAWSDSASPGGHARGSAEADRIGDLG